MQINKKFLTEIDYKNKTVFLRVDFNIPILNGEVLSTKRIDESLPTIKYLLDREAKIVILSHFGRVEKLEDTLSGEFSLKPIAKVLSEKLGNEVEQVIFINRNKGSAVEEKIKTLKPKNILLLENTRYNDVNSKGYVGLESNCDEELSKYWANLCDVFVNDAYGAAHRKHASTYGIAKYAKDSAIGFLMNQEINTIQNIIDNPIRPLTVIFGGAKVSDKIKAVENALKIADNVIISGGMAYTFLAAQGYDMGNSKIELKYIPLAKMLLNDYSDKITISSDFMCAQSFANEKPVYRTKEQGLNSLLGLDIGTNSINEFTKIIENSNSVIWNGPMGVSEFHNFEIGTKEIAKAICKRTKLGAFTIIGGGDSAAAAEKLAGVDGFSWISTGGGATLSLLEGNRLIALDPIGQSYIHKEDVVYKKFVLDPKLSKEYIEKYKDEFRWISPENSLSSAKEMFDISNSHINRDPNKESTNYLFKENEIKDLFENNKKVNYGLSQEDLYAIYGEDELLLNDKKPKIVKEEPKKEEIKKEPEAPKEEPKKEEPEVQVKIIEIIKEIKPEPIPEEELTEEELEKIARLKRKGISKSGLKIRELINDKKHEIELLEKNKNKNEVEKAIKNKPSTSSSKHKTKKK